MKAFFDWLKNLFAQKPTEAVPAPVEDPHPIVLVGAIPDYVQKLLSLLGINETKNGSLIVSFFKATSYKTNTPKTPWCAAQICYLMDLFGYQNTRSAAALGQAKLGVEMPLDQAYGVCVWKHLTGGLKGHYHTNIALEAPMSKRPKACLCVGGNQGDAVTRARYGYPDYELVAYRKPVKK